MIKFLDLSMQYSEIRAEHEAAIGRVLSSCQFVQGEEVDLFEKEFAAYLGIKHCIGVSSGTDALLLSLVALDIKAGDEVLLPTNTFIATALAVVHAGGIPIFVDVDFSTMNLSYRSALLEVTPKTKFLIPVHLYGNPAPMDSLCKLAADNNLIIIEDACQGFGGAYKGKPLGTIGAAGCYSMFPSKNLGCFGDGGAIVTDDEELAEKLRYLRNYGQTSKNSHYYLGYNHRLDSIQAAVLRVNLKYVDAWVKRRAELAALYSSLLENLVIQVPFEGSMSAEEAISSTLENESRHAWHLYVPKVHARDELREFLFKSGIETQIHYPTPCHLQPCFDYLDPFFLKTAEYLSQKIVSLPLHPSMTEADVLLVCKRIFEFYMGKTA